MTTVDRPTDRHPGARFDRHGFRIRGDEMTRTETFTDAAFAFAVTLLVISIDEIPTSYLELRALLDYIPAFAVSFLLLAVFWYGHWNWSRRFGLEDFPTIAFSLLLVFVMLSYVYPLKFLATVMVDWLMGTGRAAGRIEGWDQLYGIFAIYGTGFAAMAIVLVALNLHALRQHQTLSLSPRERFLTRTETGAWLILATVGSLSVLLALLTTPGPAVLPGWVYMLLAFVMPFYGRRSNRIAQTLPA
jgi:hypothetical protein